MIIMVPVTDELDLGPYDVLDIYKETLYDDETHFRGQDWVKHLENVSLLELGDFIDNVNDDVIDASKFWLGYVYFKRYKWIDPDGTK